MKIKQNIHDRQEQSLPKQLSWTWAQGQPAEAWPAGRTSGLPRGACDTQRTQADIPGASGCEERKEARPGRCPAVVLEGSWGVSLPTGA